MESDKEHRINRLPKHGRHEQDVESAGIDPWDPYLAGGVENAAALEHIIDDGIIDAELAKASIDSLTARTIARAVANALGDAPALSSFAATGAGDRLALEEEYLEVSDNPRTPDVVRTWINWLATFLFWKEHPTHPRPFSYPLEAKELSGLLIPDQLTFDQTSLTIHRRASQPAHERAAMQTRLRDLIAVRGPVARAFLSIPNVDAGDPEIESVLADAYISNYRDIDEVVESITEYADWERELKAWTDERALTGMVSLDRDLITRMTRETWDIVELEGRLYVFNQ